LKLVLENPIKLTPQTENCQDAAGISSILEKNNAITEDQKIISPLPWEMHAESNEKLETEQISPFRISEDPYPAICLSGFNPSENSVFCSYPVLLSEEIPLSDNSNYVNK